MMKRLVSLFLSLLLFFNILAPIPVHAQALPNYEGYLVDTQKVELYVIKGQAKEALNTMGTSSLMAVGQAVGSSLMVYLGVIGVAWTGVKLAESSISLGNFIVDNLDVLPEALARHVCGVILSVAQSPNYFQEKGLVITNGILSDLDIFFRNYVDAEEISMNVGLMSQSVIPMDVLTQMTDTVYNYYTTFDRFICSSYDPVTDDGYTDRILYTINELPSNATYVLIREDFYYLWILDANGNQITGSSETTSWLYYMRSINNPLYPGNFHWDIGTKTSWAWWGCDSLDDWLSHWDFGGLKVLIGDSFATAVDANNGLPLHLDRSERTPYWECLAKPFEVTLDLALDIGAGNKTLPEAGAELADPNEPSSGILSWLKSVWGVFTKIFDAVGAILDAVVAIPTAIGEFLGKIIKVSIEGDVSIGEATIQAFKDMLLDVFETLFVPSETYLDSWIESMMDILNNRTGILTYPLSLMITYLGKVGEIGDVDAVLTIPEVSWSGYVLIPKQTFSFDSFLSSNSAISTFYGYYMIVARALLIFGTLHLAWRKFDEMVRG